MSEFHCDMRSTLRSTTVTRMSGHFNAMTLHVGPPTYPAPMQQIFVITILAIIYESIWQFVSCNRLYVSFDRSTMFLAGISIHCRISLFILFLVSLVSHWNDICKVRRWQENKFRYWFNKSNDVWSELMCELLSQRNQTDQFELSANARQVCIWIESA